LLDDDRVFGAGRKVIAATVDGFRETEIESFRQQHGRHILKLRGFDGIAAVEPYLGAEIRIRADELPEAGEGRFYTFQLKGCGVFTESGDYIGNVTGVVDSGGVEILKVDRGKDETLIPFARSYLKKIDLQRRRIEVDLPEGLRELNK
jgi:16S rRNA processing protein RimM